METNREWMGVAEMWWWFESLSAVVISEMADWMGILLMIQKGSLGCWREKRVRGLVVMMDEGVARAFQTCAKGRWVQVV